MEITTRDELHAAADPLAQLLRSLRNRGMFTGEAPDGTPITPADVDPRLLLLIELLRQDLQLLRSLADRGGRIDAYADALLGYALMERTGELLDRRDEDPTVGGDARRELLELLIAHWDLTRTHDTQGPDDLHHRTFGAVQAVIGEDADLLAAARALAVGRNAVVVASLDAIATGEPVTLPAELPAGVLESLDEPGRRVPYAVGSLWPDEDLPGQVRVDLRLLGTDGMGDELVGTVRPGSHGSGSYLLTTEDGARHVLRPLRDEDGRWISRYGMPLNAEALAALVEAIDDAERSAGRSFPLGPAPLEVHEALEDAGVGELLMAFHNPGAPEVFGLQYCVAVSHQIHQHWFRDDGVWLDDDPVNSPRWTFIDLDAEDAAGQADGSGPNWLEDGESIWIAPWAAERILRHFDEPGYALPIGCAQVALSEAASTSVTTQGWRTEDRDELLRFVRDARRDERAWPVPSEVLERFLGAGDGAVELPAGPVLEALLLAIAARGRDMARLVGRFDAA